MLAVAVRLGGEGWASDYCSMLKGAGVLELLEEAAARPVAEFKGKEVVQCIRWIQLLAMDVQA
jgi:hypothetical protein